MHAVLTRDGAVERSLFEAFAEGGLLFRSHLQTFMSQVGDDAALARIALLSAGDAKEIVVLDRARLTANYGYPDGGSIDMAFDQPSSRSLIT